LGAAAHFLSLQLSILSGSKAGATFVARHFPVRIGRSPSADLQFEEDGVWNEHLVIDFNSTQGFMIQASPDALVSLNGQAVQQSQLRNGDVLEFGALKLQFWLAETPQRGLGWREGLTWAGILAVCLGQVALIYWLLQSS
jgi:pSer/pThr/pTyr-binding forkhead associated (FHA) protein